jgi:ribose-phosphate pyrophosphokinase
VIAAPDMGGTKRSNAYSRFLNSEMVICYKLRKKANYVDEITIIGDVKDKNVVIVDDMIDTAGTMLLAADLMMQMGAKSIYAVANTCCPYRAIQWKIEKSPIRQVAVTDTIPDNMVSIKIKVLTVSDLFATVIDKVYNYQSISSTFIV